MTRYVLTREEQAEQRAERRERVARLTRQGMSASEIATRLDITTRLVFRDREHLGISGPRSTPLTDDELSRAHQLLEEGCSYAEVGRTLGRNDKSLMRRFPGYGWTRTEASQFAMAVRWSNYRAQAVFAA